MEPLGVFSNCNLKINEGIFHSNKILRIVDKVLFVNVEEAYRYLHAALTCLRFLF